MTGVVHFIGERFHYIVPRSEIRAIDLADHAMSQHLYSPVYDKVVLTIGLTAFTRGYIEIIMPAPDSATRAAAHSVAVNMMADLTISVDTDVMWTHNPLTKEWDRREGRPS